jgi:uncharacterized membrane protein YdjX (TVP38/TMEM64 family)
MRAAIGPRTRLAMLVVALAGAWAVLVLVLRVSKADVQAWIEPLGALAPVAFVGASVALALALVPGPLLAAAAGLLFGALAGAGLTLLAAILTAVLGLLIARRVGADGLQSFNLAWVERLAGALRRHGIWAVVAQRLTPGVPDAPCSYTAGLVGIRVRDIALGTLIGSLPRAVSYSALGDTADDPTSPQALAAVAGLALTAVLGLWVARRGILRARAAGE